MSYISSAYNLPLISIFITSIVVFYMRDLRFCSRILNATRVYVHSEQCMYTFNIDA